MGHFVHLKSYINVTCVQQYHKPSPSHHHNTYRCYILLKNINNYQPWVVNMALFSPHDVLIHNWTALSLSWDRIPTAQVRGGACPFDAARGGRLGMPRGTRLHSARRRRSGAWGLWSLVSIRNHEMGNVGIAIINHPFFDGLYMFIPPIYDD